MKKLIEYSLYLLVLLLPWQTRWIWEVGEWEYVSKSLYGTEILLGLIFLISIIYVVKNFQSSISNFQWIFKLILNWKKIFKIILATLCLCFFVLLSAILALDSSLSFYYLSKILAGVILIMLIYSFAGFTKTAYAFIAGMAIQAGLGIWQFLSQSSFASKWLGMAMQNASNLGSSVIETSDGRWLRAYGALPHPNIFAGFLVIAIFLIFILKLKKRKILIFFLPILSTALFFTFSRAAWIALIISLLFYLLINLKNRITFKKIVSLSFICFLIPVIFSFIYLPLSKARIGGAERLEVKSNIERIEYFSESLRIIKTYPFFGAGYGNYTLAVQNLINPNRESFAYQPVHNIYLFILSEIGVLGFLCLSVFLIIILSFNILLVPVLILGLFDHYLLSLYSGIMLISLCISLSQKSTNTG